MWLPVRHQDIAAVAYDTEHFTSRSVVVSEVRPGPDDAAGADRSWRPRSPRTRRFTRWRGGCCCRRSRPKPIAALEPFTRDLCRELLDATSGRTELDAAVDYAQHIPLRVIIGMLGFPQEDADMFRRFIHQVLEDVDMPPEERQAVFEEEIDAYMDARIAEHRAEPRDDLTSFLLEAEIGGQKLAPEHVRGTMLLLMIAGIDTTWSAIGASLWHLASHPEDRRRLASEPA